MERAGQESAERTDLGLVTLGDLVVARMQLGHDGVRRGYPGLGSAQQLIESSNHPLTKMRLSHPVAVKRSGQPAMAIEQQIGGRAQIGWMLSGEESNALRVLEQIGFGEALVE